MPLFGVTTGQATRDLPHAPEAVWRALTADPTPEERAAWGVDGFERVSPGLARYVQNGKAVEARLQVIEPLRRLRSSNTADGDDEEAHEFTLDPLPGGGTRLTVEVRLAFRVSRSRMRATLRAMLDGLEARARPAPSEPF